MTKTSAQKQATPAKDFSATAGDLDYILSTRAVRDRCERIFRNCESGQTCFAVDLSQLPAIADFVAKVTRDNYPTLNVPFHSRWKHFQAGGVDRNSRFEKSLTHLDPLSKAITKVDLVVTSVLLDAGAGDAWRFFEKESNSSTGRSEGLAIASLHLFTQGKLSSDPADKLRADARGLQHLSFADFCETFQVSEKNPLAGCEGRYQLLKTLGDVVANSPKIFGAKNPRVGNLVGYLVQKFPTKKIRALDVLRSLQDGLGAIWPGRVSVNGYNVGDVWPYAPLGQDLQALVPFHKLSLWLTYSLVDPLLEAGFTIDGFEELSGLPEYRNGGLFVDMQALKLRDPNLAAREHAPGSELIVEWRALTICLLDRLAPLVRQRLNKSETEFPLGKVLEGGTWAAGRIAAAQKRKGGGSPLLLQSDGTVF